MSSRTAVICAALASIVAAAPVRAQSETPEAFTQRYFEMLKASDWAGVAAHTHPEALVEFKEMMAPMAAVDSTGGVLVVLFGMQSVEEFQAASPAELYAGMMAQIMDMSGGIAGMLGDMEIEVIGAVHDDSTGIAYVVYRSRATVAEMGVSGVQVLGLKRYEGEWRALLADELGAMGSMMSGQ